MLNASSVNGQYGGFAEFYGIDAVTSETGMVAAGGLFLGKMTFPMSDGSDKVLLNAKNAGYGRRQLAPHLLWGGANGFVAKVNMDSGKAVWATDQGLTSSDGNRYYVRTVATTAAGHVLATSDERIENVYYGKLIKFEGTSGAKVWDVTYDSVSYMYGVEGDADTEVAYVTGILKGTDVDPFVTGTNLTATKGDAVVAALDVSGADGPVAQWVVQIGRGEGASVKSHGDHLYLHGKLSVPATVGSCSPLSGARGGYLIKLNKADGACVWAKDTPFNRGTAVTDGTSVWTFNSFSSKVEYDSEHTIYPFAEDQDDVFAAKYSAADGTGQWAAAIGGTGDDEVGGRGGTGATMTPSGPVYVGTAQSETISLGGLTINHLQRKRAELGLVGDASFGPNQRGETALFSMLISTIDEQPPCISSCPTGEVSAADTTIASGQCYAYTECLSDGASSMPFPCFQCDASADQKALSGLGETPPVPDENHCFVNNKCIPIGGMRPEYQYRNEPSVCEWCAPTVDANDWSLKSGFVHDRTFAQEENGQPQRSWGRRLQAGEAGQANDFDMLFEKESNGCRIMPDMAMPASPSADLTAALGGAASGAVADVAALASGAIAAVRSATPTNQHAEIAWVHYFGNSATCTKSGDVCQHTPSALADMMGQDFVTHLHYGDSVARVKVQEGLSMLIAALADSSSEDSHIADLKKDVVAHMLIPYYQGAIKSAHHMDAGADTTAKATAQTEGKVYWSVINDAIGGSGGFVTADRAYLTSMFASAASGNFNYCAASTRLHNSLPPAYQLQYVNYVREGTMVAMDSPSNKSVALKDVGLLQGAIDPKECTMPPPPSPSAPPPPIASPAPPSGPTVSPTSNSLSEGELAGIAVGAVIGAILLLLILGLVLRAFLFKEAKPIFTCLETKEAKPDLRAVAAPVATPVEVNNA